MGRFGKNVVFFAVALLLSASMFMVESSFAQTKPSVPEFSVSLQDNAVVLTILNQPVDASSRGNYTFYYDVRIMTAGYYWRSFPAADEEYTRQSTLANTTLTYPIGRSSLFPALTTVDGVPIPVTGEATFQVMALVGNLEKSYSYPDGTYSYGLVGEVSGWSSSQTINLPSNQTSPISYVSPTGAMSTKYQLTMFSPNSQTVCDGVLPFQFMLYWTYDLIPIFEHKTSYAYSIDGNPFIGMTANKTSMDAPGHGYTFVYNPSFSYMIDVSNLTDGSHEIKVQSTFDFGHTQLNDTSTAFGFVVKNSNPHMIPANTATPTPTETSVASPSADASPTPKVPEFPIIAVLAGMLCISIVFLASGKKLKK
jgi:hypothetical protein